MFSARLKENITEASSIILFILHKLVLALEGIEAFLQKCQNHQCPLVFMISALCRPRGLCGHQSPGHSGDDR